jgi:hypothetical protein
LIRLEGQMNTGIMGGVVVHSENRTRTISKNPGARNRCRMVYEYTNPAI